MHFSLLASLFFATSIVAIPVDTIQSDTVIISRVTAQVSSRIKSSIAAVKSLTNAPRGVDLTNFERDVERTAQDVSTATRTGAEEILRGPDITLLEGTSMIASLTELQMLTEESIQSYVDAKPVVIRARGGREAILRILNDHLASARAFGDAIKARFPSFQAAFGSPFAQKAQNDLKKAIEIYKKV